MDHFFKANRVYAVVGASSNPDKYGYKVLNWYKTHNIPAIPINPKNEPILGLTPVSKLADVAVPQGHDLAVSIITPPQISKQFIESITQAQGTVHSLWFQPGTHTPDILALARTKVPNVIADCILVNGDAFYKQGKL